MHGLNKLRSEFKPYISSPLLYRQYKGGDFFRFAFQNNFHWSHPLSYSLSAFRDFFRSANFSLLICLSPAFTADAIGLFNSIPAFCKCWIIISVSRFRFTTSPTLRTLLLFGIFHCPVSCPPSLSVIYWRRREVFLCSQKVNICFCHNYEKTRLNFLAHFRMIGRRLSNTCTW